MSRYNKFIFKDYVFDAADKQLTLAYSYDDVLELKEVYNFDFDYVDYSTEALERAIDNLFFMAGVSYYKAYLAPSIEVRTGHIDKDHAAFFAKTYQKGLGEFFYLNKLDPDHSIEFPSTNLAKEPIAVQSSGKLIGLGGGKDSLLSVEMLKDDENASTWSAGYRTQTQTQPLAQSVGLPHFKVERIWDRQLSALNKADALNGHVPISAILACTGAVVAVLSGKRDIVVSNEKSANEPTLNYRGFDINHQYSKSSEFEQDFQKLLAKDFGESIRYYSLLRPYSELRIAELFVVAAYDKYESLFISCNRAYVKDRKRMFWCGRCPKCAFVFLILSPFVERPRMEKLFGKNLLLDPLLEPTYRQLLGIFGEKPLECVGEVQESRTAMRMVQRLYPVLKKYEFELSEKYNYAELGPHSIPADVVKTIPDFL